MADARMARRRPSGWTSRTVADEHTPKSVDDRPERGVDAGWEDAERA
jgi:hypothetical protein